MGDKQQQQRVEAMADKALEPRKNALIALAHAAEAARDHDSVRAKADKDIARIRARADKRIEAILAKADEGAERVRQREREEMIERGNSWRAAYRAAKDVGWTSAELRAAEQPPPPRASTGKRPAPTATAGAGSGSSDAAAAGDRPQSGAAAEDPLPRSA
ncbi:hypothetical protein [Amycolatopsis rubida]|uniref:Uncharacterized protein n=1 Tax=Amycolatopsis rubida TaxID=112413 RepID=A0A1I5XIZ1_9PSEU|nr:hypothetical protein [Amycolatopsis rubida]SFQ31627.1 hypothetical protein SAMN05421854_110251 [Amycolatopsis rubida]